MVVSYVPIATIFFGTIVDVFGYLIGQRNVLKANLMALKPIWYASYASSTFYKTSVKSHRPSNYIQIT